MLDNNVITNEIVNLYYEQYYKKIPNQKIYPNEELVRFIGRNFSSHEYNARKNIKILEAGCGSGSNLWMIAKEGFDTYGIDLSNESIQLTRKTLQFFDTTANLSVQNMCHVNFPEDYFDAIVDILSSSCLTKAQGITFLKTVKKILKPNGLFFSYLPCKTSDAFLNTGESKLIDSDTLDGITRKDSPLYGNFHPLRFFHPIEYENLLTSMDFEVTYSEIASRTYYRRHENLVDVVVVAKRIS